MFGGPPGVSANVYAYSSRCSCLDKMGFVSIYFAIRLVWVLSDSGAKVAYLSDGIISQKGVWFVWMRMTRFSLVYIWGNRFCGQSLSLVRSAITKSLSASSVVQRVSL